MNDLLIKGLDLPKDGDYDYNLTIRSDGKVEGWQQVGERIVQIHSWAEEVKHGRNDRVEYEMDSFGIAGRRKK